LKSSATFMKMVIYLKKIKIRKNQYRIIFNCDYCKTSCSERESHFNIKKRHFCSRLCYSKFRKYFLSKEEQNAYKNGGMPAEEKRKRAKARSDLNHHLRDKKIKRPNCLHCNKKAQAHHEDYDKPLKVKWLCFYHHTLEHHSKEKK
jgi:hypothetical protein